MSRRCGRTEFRIQCLNRAGAHGPDPATTTTRSWPDHPQHPLDRCWRRATRAKRSAPLGMSGSVGGRWLPSGQLLAPNGNKGRSAKRRILDYVAVVCQETLRTLEPAQEGARPFQRIHACHAFVHCSGPTQANPSHGRGSFPFISRETRQQQTRQPAFTLSAPPHRELVTDSLCRDARLRA